MRTFAVLCLCVCGCSSARVPPDSGGGDASPVRPNGCAEIRDALEVGADGCDWRSWPCPWDGLVWESQIVSCRERIAVASGCAEIRDALEQCP